MRHYQVYQHMQNGCPKKRGETEGVRKNTWKDDDKTFSNLETNIYLHVQENQRTPSILHSQRSITGNITIPKKKSKDKKRILKAAKEKHCVT